MRAARRQMAGMQDPIQPSDPPDPAAWRVLSDLLGRHNAPHAGPSDFRPLVLLLHDRDGAIEGGLWGRTLYGWLAVLLLVVPEARRGRGLGTALLRRAEAEAVARGCVGATLDTFSFQARPFYERLGYVCFAELPGFPPGHALYMMRKPLGLTASSVGPTPQAGERDA